jgi:general secretion pathway protein E
LQPRHGATVGFVIAGMTVLVQRSVEGCVPGSMRLAEDSSDRDSLGGVIARLLDARAVSAAAVERAKRAAELSGDRADQVLLKLGLVEEQALTAAWSSVLDLPIMVPGDFPGEPILPSALSPRFIRNAGAIPFRLDDARVRVAILDPLDKFTPHAIEARTGLDVSLALTTPSDFAAAFARLYGAADAASDDEISTNVDTVAGDVTRLRDLAADAPAIRFVDTMIERASEIGASDVHLTISRAGPRLRYRVDGVLQESEAHPGHLHDAIISRIKVMAELDIAERRLPQDGRIRIGIRGREIDLRIATMPHLDGEGVVLRILDRTAVKLKLAALGFSHEVEQRLVRLLAEPHGILLVTGPTGSGKTTTLYAALRRLVRPGINVVSGSMSSARSGSTFRPSCARSCARITTSSCSAKFVTVNPPHSPSRTP